MILRRDPTHPLRRPIYMFFWELFGLVITPQRELATEFPEDVAKRLVARLNAENKEGGTWEAV